MPPAESAEVLLANATSPRTNARIQAINNSLAVVDSLLLTIISVR